MSELHRRRPNGNVLNTEHAFRVQSSHRAGFGLTDTVGLLVCVGIILSLAALILHLVVLTQGSAMEYLAMTRNLQEAHDRWTFDTKSSIRCVVGDDLKITCSDDRQISYSLQDGHLMRLTAERNGPDAPLQVIGQEYWRLPPGCQVNWSIDRSYRVPLVACSLEVPNRPSVRWVSRAEQSTVAQEQESEQ